MALPAFLRTATIVVLLGVAIGAPAGAVGQTVPGVQPPAPSGVPTAPQPAVAPPGAHGPTSAPAVAVQFDVRTLQRRLRVKRILVPVNGTYDKRTRAGVRILQRTHGLPVTGVVDAAVLTALGIKQRAVASEPTAGVTPVLEPNDQTPSSAGFVWPVNGTISSLFGPRGGRMHEGIDIAADTGTSIRAAAAGIVTFAGTSSGYGQLTIIDHPNGMQTAYAHQSAIGVTVGQAVARGQEIGKVGSTGRSTGPHLHFEIRANGAAVDPVPSL